MAIEGAFEFLGARPVRWSYGYLVFPVGERLTRDRDFALYAALRVGPPCERRVCFDTAVGVGFSTHTADTFITTDCGSVGRPHPCIDVTPPDFIGTESTREPLFVLGANVPIRLNDSVSIVPTARYYRIWRRHYLAFDHRGPYSGGGSVPGAGVDVTWRLRR